VADIIAFPPSGALRRSLAELSTAVGALRRRRDSLERQHAELCSVKQQIAQQARQAIMLADLAAAVEQAILDDDQGALARLQAELAAFAATPMPQLDAAD